MKKIYLALMCMTAVAMLTACGGGNTKKDGSKMAASEAVEKAGKAADDAKTLGKNNCLEIAKANYGVALPAFDGCEVETAQSLSNRPEVNMDITYKITGDFDTTVKDVLSRLFDATAQVSSDGNYEQKMNFETNKTEFSNKKFANADAAMVVNSPGQSYVAAWNYTFGSVIEMVNFNATPKGITISFTKGGNK